MFKRRVIAALLTVCLGVALLPARAAAQGCAAAAFWDWHLQGERLRLAPYVPYVGDRWNDQISSIRIYHGIWRFYIDTNFQGGMMELGPGTYSWSAGDMWNDSISSFRCVRPTD